MSNKDGKNITTLQVPLGARSYPIYIGHGLLGRRDLWERHIPGRAVVISNETIAPLYLKPVAAALGKRMVGRVALPDGEEYKTLEVLERLLSELLRDRVDRDATLVALGGGVVGDIVGFAAAILRRGVAFVQAPTTLLAQVDSAVGGKTGVNHPLGKNMIGVFHQPQAVFADLGTLDTLPAREFSSGLAEVIKYGLIADAEFFAWLEDNMPLLMARNDDALRYAIRRSCELKAAVVARDEEEKSGARMLLNLGHTFGHALETGLGHGRMLHGEAVACGMLMAAELSAQHGELPAEAVARARAIIAAADLPDAPPKELAVKDMLDLMGRDKKNTGGKQRLVLLNSIGDAFVADRFERARLRDYLTDRAARLAGEDAGAPGGASEPSA